MNNILHPLYFDLYPQGATVTPRAHGVDISKYDSFFRPETASAQLDFVIQRVSYGVTRDEAYTSLLSGVKQMGICGAYHYLSSWYDYRTQADAFLYYMDQERYDFIACDFEDAYNNLSLPFAKIAWDWIHYIAQKTGKPVLLYTNLNLYNNYIYPSQAKYGIDWNDVDLWQAQIFFLPNPDGTPPTPKGRTKPWRLWQYSWKGDGTLYGVARPTACDLNVYNGTPAEMKQWLGKTEPPDTGEPMNETHQGLVQQDLNIRTGPGVGYPAHLPAGGVLHRGDIVYGVLDASKWFHFDRIDRAAGNVEAWNGWASATSGNYMVVSPYTPQAPNETTIKLSYDAGDTLTGITVNGETWVKQ